MKIITNLDYSVRINPMYCLDNDTIGGSLYNKLEYFTEQVVKYYYFELEEFDGIITILRAGLPLGLKLYQSLNKPIGFVSAKRNKDLSVEITYKNVPEFENPLIADSWIASGSTVQAVCELLNIKKINLFGVIATKQAIDYINPDNYIIGVLTDKLNSVNYIVPPSPYKPRDIGDDLFLKVSDNKKNRKKK